MKKTIFLNLLCLLIAFAIKAQQLNTFTIQVLSKKDANNFVSMSLKKSATAEEVKTNASSFDIALQETKDGSITILKWYNLSGKEGNMPKGIAESFTLINTISLDKDQFDQCKTVKDFERMTGHITKNSFSHFASVTDDISKGIIYHCFIIQQENGNRALIWLEELSNGNFTILAKVRG